MSKNSTSSRNTSVDTHYGRNTVWRLPQVLADRARSRSAHYADIQSGLLTHPVQIGLRAVAWPAYEVQQINAARIAGLSDEQIRKLVKQLEEERKQATQEVES